MRVDDVLDSAAKLVEQPGWWNQHTLFKRDWCDGSVTSVCAMGALIYVITGDVKSSEIMAGENGVLFEEASRALEARIDTSIPRFNDQPSRTADEVATAMREAAAEWRISHGK